MWSLPMKDLIQRGQNSYSNQNQFRKFTGDSTTNHTGGRLEAPAKKKKPNYCWTLNKGHCKAGTKCKFMNRCSYCDAPDHGLTQCTKAKEAGKTEPNNFYFLFTDKPDLEPLFFTNFDLVNAVTPVDADRLDYLLKETNYKESERDFIVEGFRNGFDIPFKGKIEGVRRFARNLKFRIGSEVILWNKIMKEVKLKRYAGPYETPLLVTSYNHWSDLF